jgi:hypothetical protein
MKVADRMWMPTSHTGIGGGSIERVTAIEHLAVHHLLQCEPAAEAPDCPMKSDRVSHENKRDCREADLVRPRITPVNAG